MRIFLDTNILLDVLLKREKFHKESLTLVNLCQDKKHDGWISMITVANLFYIGSKLVGKKEALEVIETLIGFLQVTGGNTETVLNALHDDFRDFEDALQNSCANDVAKMEAIITRNSKDFKNSRLPIFTPKEFVNAF